MLPRKTDACSKKFSRRCAGDAVAGTAAVASGVGAASGIGAATVSALADSCRAAADAAAVAGAGIVEAVFKAAGDSPGPSLGVSRAYIATPLKVTADLGQSVTEQIARDL